MDANLKLELEAHGYVDCEFSYKAVQAVLMVSTAPGRHNIMVQTG